MCDLKFDINWKFKITNFFSYFQIWNFNCSQWLMFKNQVKGRLSKMVWHRYRASGTWVRGVSEFDVYLFRLRQKIFKKCSVMSCFNEKLFHKVFYFIFVPFTVFYNISGMDEKKGSISDISRSLSTIQYRGSILI